MKLKKNSLKIYLAIIYSLLTLVLVYIGWPIVEGLIYKPHDVLITNITSTSATVSWVTDTKMPGVVIYKESDSFFPFLGRIGADVAYDDRDYSYAQTKCVEEFNNEADQNVDNDFVVSGDNFDCTDIQIKEKYAYYTHHVTLRDLDPEKTYYFKVGNEVLKFGDDSYAVTTYKTEDSVKEPIPIFGRIVNTEGEYTADSIAYFRFIKSGDNGEIYSIPYSTVTNKDGGWYIDGGNLRDVDGQSFTLVSGEDTVNIYPISKTSRAADASDFVFGSFDGAYPDVIVSTEVDNGNALVETVKAGTLYGDSTVMISNIGNQDDNWEPQLVETKPKKNKQDTKKDLDKKKDDLKNATGSEIELSGGTDKGNGEVDTTECTIANIRAGTATECTIDYLIKNSTTIGGGNAVKACSANNSLTIQDCVDKIYCTGKSGEQLTICRAGNIGAIIPTIPGTDFATSADNYTQISEFMYSATVGWSYSPTCKDLDNNGVCDRDFSLNSQPINQSQSSIDVIFENGELSSIWLVVNTPTSTGDSVDMNITRFFDEETIKKISSNCTVDSCNIELQPIDWYNIVQSDGFAQCYQQVECNAKLPQEAKIIATTLSDEFTQLYTYYEGAEDLASEIERAPYRIGFYPEVSTFDNQFTTNLNKTSLDNKISFLNSIGYSPNEGMLEDISFKLEDGEVRFKYNYTDDIQLASSWKTVKNEYLQGQVFGEEFIKELNVENYITERAYIKKEQIDSNMFNGFSQQDYQEFWDINYSEDYSANIFTRNIPQTENVISIEYDESKEEFIIKTEDYLDNSKGQTITVKVSESLLVPTSAVKNWLPSTPSENEICEKIDIDEDSIEFSRAISKPVSTDLYVPQNQNPDKIVIIDTGSIYPLGCLDAQVSDCTLAQAQNLSNILKATYPDQNFFILEDDDKNNKYTIFNIPPTEEIIKLREKYEQDPDSIDILGLFTPLQIKPAYAATENINYMPDIGMYSMEVAGYQIEKSVTDSEAYVSYFIDRNGIDGYQIPIDPENPSIYEDKILNLSSFQINYTKTASARTYDLSQGINIVSFDFLPKSTTDDTPYNAKELVKSAKEKGVNIEYITYFDNGRWVDGYKCTSATCVGSNFTIVPGKGYLVKTAQDGKIVVGAYELSTPIPVELSNGWNLIGIHGYPKAFTAEALLQSINTIDNLTADNVTWYPTDKGRYEGFQYTDEQAFGLDFAINPSTGYFIRVSDFSPEDESCKSIIWHYDAELNGTCANTKSLF